MPNNMNIPVNPNTPQNELATFAGGCFWCMAAPFENLDGVISLSVGYTGGDKENPTYQEVCTQTTGHYEAVQILFDPARISYDQLLDVFWRQIDPTDQGGQFQDRGQSYQTAIFYHNDIQRRTAEASRDNLAKSGRFPQPLVTKILPAATFYKAEEYHQNYHKKNAFPYLLYNQGSGRKKFSNKHWPPDNSLLKEKLTKMQYYVTRENGTEPPFQNEFWDNKKAGIYVDIVSGEPLFSSLDKFDSGCGWPSFTKPLLAANIQEKPDLTHNLDRTEVRSKQANSNLGHVFPDGPGPAGLRYCINSAALRFIPKEDLEREGYADFKILFRDKNNSL